MKYNYIATFEIRLLLCRYLSTKVTSLLRSLWPSPMGDRYRGVRLYLGRNEFANAKDNEFNSAAISLLCRIQKLAVQIDHFSQFCQSSSYLSHYKTKQFHQSWPTSASLQDWQTGL